MELDTQIIYDQPGALILNRSRGNVLIGIFLLVWLSGWSYFLFSIIKDTLSNESEFPLLAFLLVSTIVVGGFTLFIYKCFGREKLLIGKDGIEWELTAILRFRHRLIPLSDVIAIDLRATETSEDGEDENNYVGVLLIKGTENEINFGKGLSGEELHKLLDEVRVFVESNLFISLEPVKGALEIAPISDSEWQEKKEEENPETTSDKIIGWITVPVFILAGCLMLYGGIQAILSGHFIGIIFGLFFVILGFFLSVSLTWATISIFKEWLQSKK
jgi:hypothetical protein